MGLGAWDLVHWHCSIFLTAEASAKEVALLGIDTVAAFQQDNPQQQRQDNKPMNQVFFAFAGCSCRVQP